MLTIKTKTMTITRTDNKILGLTPTYDELHIKFPDGVELNIPFKSTQATSSLLQIVTQSKAENITIDFTSPNLVSFS